MKEEGFWILLSKKIAGEASPAELELLEEMIMRNSEWKATAETLQELWNSEPVKPVAENTQKKEDAYLLHISRLKETVNDFESATEMTPGMEMEEAQVISIRKPFYKNWITYVAAAAAIVLVIMIYPLASSKEKVQDIAAIKPLNEITVNPGSRTKMQLPDGSQVWVNSGSKLTYDGNFNGATREVQLDGEAFFEVVKDAAHPFIVHTSGIDIKVLGTAFDVKAYNSEPTIEATLIHGSIEVINKSQPGTPKIMLKPHEKLVFNKFAIPDVKDQRADIKTNPDAYSYNIKPLRENIADTSIAETAWVYNKLRFEDEKFSDVALKMGRWYNLKISIENEKLSNFRMSGSFVNETVEEALRDLQFLVPFNYSIKNNEIKILKK